MLRCVGLSSAFPFFEQGESYAQVGQGAGLFGQFLFQLLEPRRRHVRGVTALSALGFQPGQRGPFDHALDLTQVVQMDTLLTQGLTKGDIRRTGAQVQFQFAIRG